jgi:hypothetical protein
MRFHSGVGEDGDIWERGWAVVWQIEGLGLVIKDVCTKRTCLNFGPISGPSSNKSSLSFIIQKICLLKLSPMQTSARQLAAVMRDQPVLPSLL